MLLSTSQQMKEEFADMYRRMTDPVERQKQRMKEYREQFAAHVATDAGL